MANDDLSRDERLANLLVEYDAALAADTPPDDLDTSAVDEDADLAAEWDQAKGFLELLDRVRRRWSPEDVSGETLAWEREALSTPPDRPPLTLGRFEIQRKLGQGGLGIVYLAYDPTLRRQVALKVPRPGSLSSHDLRRRFLREAEAAARLSHPHLVTVLETGEEGPICYIAAEYCPGPTLSAWLNEREQPVPIDLAAHLTMDLAEAVQHAHGRGVLHRDIKPSNVLLAPLEDLDGQDLSGPKSETSEKHDAARSHDRATKVPFRPKLTDFGMAKLLEQKADETRSGALIGTPAYMAPEQAEGRVRDLDARTDIYGLGALLYELLTDRRPHEGETDVDLLRRVLFEEPVAPRRLRSDIPRDLEAICLKCLAKRSNARYATAQELADDLGRFLSGQPTEARPLGTAGRVLKWARRRPAMAALVAVCLLSLATLTGGALVYSARLSVAAVAKDAALKKAVESEGRMKTFVYAAEMQLAQQAFSHSDVARTQEYLTRHIPATDEVDQREFAWHFLWNAQNRALARLPRHPADVYSLAFAPDGRRLATACRDGYVRVWNLPQHTLAAQLGDHEDEVNVVAFSPDGTLLAAGDNNGQVVLRDAQRFQIKQRLIQEDPGEQPWVLGLVFSPDGRRVYTVVDQNIIAWEVDSGSCLWQVEAHDAGIKFLAISGDGQWLVSGAGGPNGSVKLRSTESPQMEAWKIPGGYFAARFLPDGQRIALAFGQFVEIYDLSTRKRLAKITAMRTGNVVALDASEDGHHMAIGATDRTIQVYDAGVKAIAQLRGHTDRVWDVKFAPDGEMLASAGADGEVLFWRTPRDEQFRRPDGALTRFQHDRPLLAVAYSPDGKLLACGGEDKLDILDRRTGSVTTLPASERKIAGLQFTQDGRLIAVDQTGTFQVWDPRTGQLRTIHQAACDEVRSLALSPREDRLAVSLMSDGSSAVRVFSWPDMKELHFIPFSKPVHVVRFTPSGDQFAVGQEGNLAIYDTESGQQTMQIGQAGEVFYDLDFLPDGERMIVAEGRQGATLRSVQSGDVLAHLSGHLGEVLAVAASANGRNVASVCKGYSMCVWDLTTQQSLLTFNNVHASSIPTLSFSPTGDELSLTEQTESSRELTTWDATAPPQGK